MTGRYVESDPIGLAGGTSTFGYGGGDPFNHSDSTGLFVPALVAPAVEEGLVNTIGGLYVLLRAHGVVQQRGAEASADKSHNNIILFPTPKPGSYECAPGDDRNDSCERERRRLQGNRDMFMRVVDGQTDPGKRARMLREFAELFNPVVETHNWTYEHASPLLSLSEIVVADRGAAKAVIDYLEDGFDMFFAPYAAWDSTS